MRLLLVKRVIGAVVCVHANVLVSVHVLALSHVNRFVQLPCAASAHVYFAYALGMECALLRTMCVGKKFISCPIRDAVVRVLVVTGVSGWKCRALTTVSAVFSHEAVDGGESSDAAPCEEYLAIVRFPRNFASILFRTWRFGWALAGIHFRWRQRACAWRRRW